MSDMDSLADEAARALAECPIPTPWTSERMGHSEVWYITGPDWSNGRTCHVAQVAGSGMGSTAALIAAAVNGLPALLERVEAAEGALNEADSVLSYIVHRGEIHDLSEGTQEQVRETLASVQKITRRRA